MPVKRTTVKGQPAYKFGDSGKAYPYTAGDAASRADAKAKAEKYGRAVASNNRNQQARKKGK